MIRLLISLFLLLILVETSLAAKFLPNAFDAEFIQEKQKVNSKKIIKSRVDVKYLFPNNIYFKTIGDVEIHYICNTSRVWIYSPPFIPGQKGTVKVGNSSKFCYSKIFDALSNGLKNNSLYDVKKSSAKKYKLTFKPKAVAQLGLDKLELHFKSDKAKFDNLERAVLYYKDDSIPVSLVTKNILIKNSLPVKLFNFKVPENTNTQEIE